LDFARISLGFRTDRLLQVFTLDARGIFSGESDYPVDLELINGLGLGSLGSGRTSR
jgi:hypothetical protein